MHKDDAEQSGDLTLRRSRGRPRAFDRTAALDAATTLFWTNGYEATSISDLTEAMGIGAKSLYAAFGSKDALFTEALHHYVRKYGGLAWDRAREAPTAREAASAFLYDSAAALSGSVCDMPRGCMATIASLGCEGLAAVGEFAASIETTFQRLEARLKKGVDDGDLPPSVDVAQLARFVETVQSGMSVKARNGADRAELEGVAKVAMAGWDGIVRAANAEG
ncbi:TetR/AcrR family transcriptional regulator [Caulobacter segnis]|uniref:TetR/AcrR family transcriptional regulator n=1 Tax=Caulobacter segnis TaxID=88688 RepID=UPI0024106A06|nr:TetR/AcrR family transcriptional regulator [Caulobacter segnis]MDG2520553.1 TetR/AcrR family transcriptional regulator [Caulobacter segnis]